MKPDPIVEQVHRVRVAISRRFGDDLNAIAEHARRRSAEAGRKTVTLPPRPVQPPQTPPGNGRQGGGPVQPDPTTVHRTDPGR